MCLGTQGLHDPAAHLHSSPSDPKRRICLPSITCTHIATKLQHIMHKQLEWDREGEQNVNKPPTSYLYTQKAPSSQFIAAAHGQSCVPSPWLPTQVTHSFRRDCGEVLSLLMGCGQVLCLMRNSGGVLLLLGSCGELLFLVY